MGLKILHSADWHLCSPLSSFPGEAGRQLKAALQSIPDRVGDLLARESCDLVLLAGDLFDGPQDPAAVASLKRTLHSWQVPVLIAPGNHDPASPGSCWQETWPENVHVFRESLESVALPGLDCRVWGAGYQSMDCPGLLEGFRAQGQETYQIGILHGDPLNASSPCCPVTAAQVEGSGLAYLALGHIHAAGQLTRGQTLCGWPGSPMARGWDETGEKYVYLVDLGDRPRIQKRSLGLPQFWEDRLEIGMDPLAQIRRLLPAAGSRDHFRITLEGEGPVELEELCAHLRDFPNLTLRDRTEAPGDLWAGAGEDSLEGALFGRLREAAAGAQGRDRDQLLLAAKFCRRILEGREVKL